MTVTALLAARPSLHVPGEPPERRGQRRDHVRLLASWRRDGRLVHARFADLPAFLVAGDLLVVNTSATLAASVPTGDGLRLHLATPLPTGHWLVELRRPQGFGTVPFLDATRGRLVRLPNHGTARLLDGFPAGQEGQVRLWVAALDLPDPLELYLAAHGSPIRYAYAGGDWPLSDYQTVFAREPGSAEMPSAARPFTAELVTTLVSDGVAVAPILLHSGVSSPEAHEPPAPERFRVPAATARLVNTTRAAGGRVVAVGTTVVRALETTADEAGVSHPGQGWTELVIDAERGVRVVDGIISGWHPPEASHLHLLEAVAGRDLLEEAYEAATAEGYAGHEFGDSHLVLP